MPIIAGDRTSLQQSITEAFEKSRQIGATDGNDPSQVIADLSNEIAQAIEDYVLSITVKIVPGIAVTTDPTTGIGSTTTEGMS